MDPKRYNLLLVGLRKGMTLEAMATPEEIAEIKALYKMEITRPFGIETEFYSERPRLQVSTALSRLSQIEISLQGYRSGSDYGQWAITSDGSIEPKLRDIQDYRLITNKKKISVDEFHSVELISPKLSQSTLWQIRKVFTAVNNWGERPSPGLPEVPYLQVNPTCGFHVHISVEHNSQEERARIVSVFQAIESDLDLMLPDHRCTTRYAKSIKDLTYEQLSKSNKYLSLRINGGNRTVTGDPATFEYRRHSATRNANLIINWVRILDAIHLYGESLNSAPSKTLNFYDVVKNPILQNYFNKRRKFLREHGKYNELKKGLLSPSSLSNSTSSVGITHSAEIVDCEATIPESPTSVPSVRESAVTAREPSLRSRRAVVAASPSNRRFRLF